MHDICSVTKNTYIQTFHFKTISRTVATNRLLNVIGKSESSYCTFCSNHIETFHHLFWECRHVQCFISEVTTKLRVTCNTPLNLSKSRCFFPCLERCSKIEMLIITIAKLTIYKSRIASNQPDVRHFANLLRLEAEKELGSARQRNAPELFSKKWGNFVHIVDVSEPSPA